MTAHFTLYRRDSLDDGGMFAIKPFADLLQRKIGMLAQQEKRRIAGQDKILPAGFGGELRRREIKAAADKLNHILKTETWACPCHIADDLYGHFFRDLMPREL